MFANDQSVEMEQLIAALRLDKNARRALEWTVADLCKQVPDSTSFLHSLFKYCADKQAGRLNRVKEIFALQALGSATEKAKAAVEKARILNSKNAIGRDRQRCAVKCDPGFAEDIENGKIYVSQKGLCRIFEPPQKDPIYTCRLIQENGLYKAIELAKGEDGADLPLLKEQEWKAWQENLNTLTHQEDIREAVLTSQGFVKANASIGDTAPSLVLLWDKIERFVEIILNPENEKKRKEEVEKFVRRIGELPLRQEGATLANGFEVAQQRINSDVATEQEDKVKLAAMGSRIDAVKAQLKRISVIEGPILLYVASLSEIRNPEALEKFEKVLVQVEAYCSGQQVNFVSANGDSLTAITHITPELSESAQASSSGVDASVVDLNPAHISAPVAKVYVGTGISGSSVDSSIDSSSSTPASSSEFPAVSFELTSLDSINSSPWDDIVFTPRGLDDEKDKGEESEPSLKSGPHEDDNDEDDAFKLFDDNINISDFGLPLPASFGINPSNQGVGSTVDVLSGVVPTEQSASETYPRGLKSFAFIPLSDEELRKRNDREKIGSNADNGELGKETDRLLGDEKREQRKPLIDKTSIFKKKPGAKDDEKKPLLEIESSTEDEQDSYSTPDSGEDRDPEDRERVKEKSPGDEIEGTDSKTLEDRLADRDKERRDRDVNGKDKKRENIKPKDEGELTGSEEEEKTTDSPRLPLRALERVELDGGALWSVVEENVPPLVPAVTTSAASKSALPPGSSTTHLITGLSPFYRELRGVYRHLKDDPEGYKHISIRMLNEYIRKLKEIKASKDLKIKGRDLWETLNPAGADFQAEQLLEASANGKNILEEALIQHEQQYLPEFKAKLSVDGGVYEPQGKCYYFETKESIIYLMLKKGAKPSRTELQEAYREYNVICQDMFNKIDAEIYICDSEFNRDPKNQKEVAAIITRLDVKLAEDDQVQGNNKAVHEAVHKISIKMKDPEPATASKLVDENSLTAETVLNYRVVLENNRSTLLETKESDGLEREQYLDMVYEWEKDSNWASYLQGVSTVSRLLPYVTKKSYKEEKVLVHLNPLELDPEQLKKVERESTKRDTERRQHYEGEKRIEATISARAEDTDWLEKDIAAAKAEALEITRIIARECSLSDSDTEGFDPNELERARKVSLETYEAERRSRLKKGEHKFDIHNVDADGNCFYHAVADQMKQQGISRFNQPNVDLHVSLRHLVQGGNYRNGEWAGVYQLFTLVKKAQVIIAVMDTRHPHLGFRCYYRDRQGNLAETYDSDELKRQAADQTIIHLAYTGAHYMSIRGYRDLQVGACQGSFNITARQQQSQSVRAEHSEQDQSRANVLSEKENTKPNLWGQHTVRLEQAFNTAVDTKKPRTLFEHKSEHSHPFNFFPDPVEEVADPIEEAAESVEQHKSSSVTLRLRDE